MSGGGLYEQVMAELGGAAPEAPAPRLSASVVLWRPAGRSLEVFWLRRSRALSFMGGWHAFPGGALSRRDAALAADAGRPSGLPEELGPEIAVCALRELFEETGLLLARDGARAAAAAEGLRRRLLDGEGGLEPLLAAGGLRPDASPLVWAGRWVTPPFGPLRFDNSFFLLRWPAERRPQPAVLPGEAEHGEWIEPGEALERWERGEVITAPPILHILRVLWEDGPEGGLGRLREPREADLGPWRRIEFTPGVLLFPLPSRTLPPASRTNSYLLGFGESVLVDPGCPFEEELEKLAAALAAAGERLGRKPAAIWLTHHHPDHVAGVEWLRRRFGLPVLAHRLTAERLAARGLTVDGELRDGQRVLLAGEPPMRLRIVHTPGHARGHLCFFDEERRTLVAGDMVAGLGTIVIDPPEGDMDDYLASLRKLRSLEPRVLYPAHGPVAAGAAAKLDATIRHRLWREERIVAAWRDGLREGSGLAARVYDDVPAAALPLARRQLEAHLDRLRAAGRLA